ncbi:olfactory protein-like [Bufo gargarizans]|uniref:olfactory protein-like n=1 Tax=Bufo gargarizans TaxID=30331 RepID=UPI001CF33805|nr:olfactory protein-like [Bufo gargarizans]
MLQITASILLLLFIQCQAGEVKVQDNFDTGKFMGMWYALMAASNCPMFEEMKAHMTRPIVVYTMHGKTVKTSMAFRGPEGCAQMDDIMETLAPGHYKHKSESHHFHTAKGDSELTIVHTNYNSHAMEFRRTAHPGGTCITVNLQGRNTDLPEEVKAKFIDYIQHLGLSEKDMTIFSKGEECIPK